MSADPLEHGPEIVNLPSQRMAVLYVKGRPDRVLPPAIATLQTSLFALKFALARTGGPSVPFGRVRARFPDAGRLPEDEWTTVLGLCVPESTQALPQQVGGEVIRLETWEYGTVAQLARAEGDLHGADLAARLQRFIEQSGRVIVGDPEEEYLEGRASLAVAVVRYRVLPA